jgi:pimeloyl-ACP methyl ester carboxylesterase
MGRSTVHLGEEPLPVEEAEDFHDLLCKLSFSPAILYGCSSGARTSALLAARHPTHVQALVFAPPTGGDEECTRILAKAYYQKYVDIVDARGMNGILEEEHYKTLMEMNEANKQLLASLHKEEFRNAMVRASHFIKGHEKSILLGLDNDTLQQLDLPVLVLHHGNGKDKVHKQSAAEKVAGALNAEMSIVETQSEVIQKVLDFIQKSIPPRVRSKL